MFIIHQAQTKLQVTSVRSFTSQGTLVVDSVAVCLSQVDTASDLDACTYMDAGGNTCMTSGSICILGIFPFFFFFFFFPFPFYFFLNGGNPGASEDDRSTLLQVEFWYVLGPPLAYEYTNQIINVNSIFSHDIPMWPNLESLTNQFIRKGNASAYGHNYSGQEYLFFFFSR